MDGTKRQKLKPEGYLQSIYYLRNTTQYSLKYFLLSPFFENFPLQIFENGERQPIKEAGMTTQPPFTLAVTADFCKKALRLMARMPEMPAGSERMGLTQCGDVSYLIHNKEW
jgi:hypothetical protein